MALQRAAERAELAPRVRRVRRRRLARRVAGLRLLWLRTAEAFWYAVCERTGGCWSRHYARWEAADDELRAARRSLGLALIALVALGAGCTRTTVRPDPVVTVRPCVVEVPSWPHLPVGDIAAAAGSPTEAPLAAASFRLLLGYAEALELALESCR